LVFGLTLVMTEVDGPLAPPLRFSSLLIRGAAAAQDADLDDRALEVECDMAQAFEIPRENRTAHNGRLAIAAADIAELPATLSRSPLPVRPSGWIGIRKYGLGAGHLQAPRNCSRRCSGTVRDPTDSRFGDRPKVNHSCRI
jgi:hypothetical protein